LGSVFGGLDEMVNFDGLGAITQNAPGTGHVNAFRVSHFILPRTVLVL